MSGLNGRASRRPRRTRRESRNRPHNACCNLLLSSFAKPYRDAFKDTTTEVVTGLCKNTISLNLVNSRLRDHSKNTCRCVGELTHQSLIYTNFKRTLCQPMVKRGTTFNHSLFPLHVFDHGGNIEDQQLKTTNGKAENMRFHASISSA